MNDPRPVGIGPANPDAIPTEVVRCKLLELLGLEELPPTIDYDLSSPHAGADGLLEYAVEYANLLGEKVPGILCVPQGMRSQRAGGVICLPGSTQTAQDAAYPMFHYEGAEPGRLIGWGRELARHGFVTLSLTYKGTPVRRGSAAQWENEARALTTSGRTQLGVAVDEALRGARVLAEGGHADPSRIGVAGHSLGGQIAWHAMACAPWLAAAVANCGGLGSLARFIQEGDIGRHGPSFYTPHMLRFFDHAQVVEACITPRPLMMVAPTEDTDMTRSGVEDLMRIVTPAYHAAGFPDRFRVYQPSGGHIFSPQCFEWMVSWFEQYLGEEGSAAVDDVVGSGEGRPIP